MTKTPQQIKNEVEKEIEVLELKMKQHPKREWFLNTFKIDRDNIGINAWNEKEIDDILDRRVFILNAQLSILTEYDKSIKEMIEDWINKHWLYFIELSQEDVIKSRLNELLSEIGDNSELNEYQRAEQDD